MEAKLTQKQQDAHSKLTYEFKSPKELEEDRVTLNQLVRLGVAEATAKAYRLVTIRYRER